jgi:hypothetical protein
MSDKRPAGGSLIFSQRVPAAPVPLALAETSINRIPWIDRPSIDADRVVVAAMP